jgi:serine/threonine protein kinase/TPR repeat protein
MCDPFGPTKPTTPPWWTIRTSPLRLLFVAENHTEELGRFEHYRVMTDANGKPVKLGEGAMGVTYLAEDKNLRVKVALKVIAPNLLGDSEIVQRFQREAQAAARLRHPNVAAVYHLGEVDDTFFYTMEFVEGKTLREHVSENGPLPVPLALAVTLQMCDALGAAEKHQMVHRDIKPANIMLETTDDGLNAKLIDFGLAKPLQHDAQQTSALLTQRGTFLGTAVFASPEQVQDLPLDTRSDFYALGLTMWVMLEGRPPFEGSLHKVLYDQVHTKPPFERLMWVPSEVRTLLSKVLEKDPGDRPQTARELRQMIHDCQRALGSSTGGGADWQKRFQVRQAPRAQPWGTIYEGQDSLSGEVWLHFLNSDRFSDTDALNRVIAAIRRAVEIHHPNVLRHITIFPAHSPQGDSGWMVVTEHPGTHTLLGHLQQVKQLPVNEALPLIERLGEALDCCLASDLPSADLDASRIFLKPQSAPGGTGPVEVVPKLIPLNYTFSSSMRGGEETAIGLTQVSQRGGEARTAQDAVQRLATLAYQCMGGSWQRMTRYIPLPGLSQQQNETLREALAEKKFSHASEFIDALRQTKVARRTVAAASPHDATVTLSPWERLAAIAAAPPSSIDTVRHLVPEVAADVSTPVAKMPALAEEEAPVEQEVPYEAEAPAEPFDEEASAVSYEEQQAAEAQEEAPAYEEPALAEEPAALNTNGTPSPATGHATSSGRSNAIAALRKTVEREWRDAKPIINKVATPVRDTVTTLPRWIFISLAAFVVVVGVVLWAIANRPVPTIVVDEPEVDPGHRTEVARTPGRDVQSPTTVPDIPPVKPPVVNIPPVSLSLDQLLDAGTEAATRGNADKLREIWQDLQKRFPDKWGGLTKSAGFINAVTNAWQADKLGDVKKATVEFLPIIAISPTARRNEVVLLRKLSENLDAENANRFELTLLDALQEQADKGSKEALLDEAVRLVELRKTGPVATRARDLIRQELEPLVEFREEWKRPDDKTEALRVAMRDLGPKFEALAATEVPAALYLYADKLRTDGKKEESLAKFEKAAYLEHVPSMIQAGLIHSNKKDPDSLKRAITWFTFAESKKSPKASFALGECYLDGKGVARDYALALKYLDAAASENISEAHNLLGDVYRQQEAAPGSNLEPLKFNPALQGAARLAKAREHYENAVKFGSEVANGPLAGMLIEGVGGPRDLAKGISHLDVASKIENPDPVILRNYAYLLMSDLLPGLPFTRAELNAAKVKPNDQLAKELMIKAAKAEDVPAQDWCRSKGVRY